MDAVTINQDIYDIHGHQITRASDVLSGDYLASLADSCRFKKNTNKPVRGTFISDDLHEALNHKRYEAIFNHQGIKDEILKVIGGVSLNPILYEEFDLMKKRDFYTYRHVLLTTALTVRMAMDIYSDTNKIPDIAEAAFTHDFGKARVPLNILQKTNFLTPDENDFIAGHPTVGYLLLIYYQGALNSLNSKVAFEHHEKIDGSGYPRGIKESNPIVELVTTSDIYDALISERPYRKETYTVRAALDYLTREMDDGKLDETTVCLLASYNRKNDGFKKNVPLSRNFRGIPPAGSSYAPIKKKGDLKK
ncbi:MAG: HD domain-containing protein [Nitrospirae bacterium]|nr:HD domain-containing protein [Nitrospirota bacterium]